MSVASTFRSLGPRDFASYALLRMVGPIPGLSYHRYHLIAVPRSGMPPMPRGFHVRPLDRSEMIPAAVGVSDEAIEHRLRQGCVCLGSFREGTLTGATWITDSAFEEDEIRAIYELENLCAWDTGLHIRAEHRLGRSFAALWAGTARWLESRGLDWSMSRITDYNDNSRRAHERMAARRIGSICAVQIAGVQWLWSDLTDRAERTRADEQPPRIPVGRIARALLK